MVYYEKVDNGLSITKFHSKDSLDSTFFVPEQIDGMPVVEIGSRKAEKVFAPQRKIEHLLIPDSVKKINPLAFKATQIEQNELPKGLKTISDSAFYFSRINGNLELPNSLVNIKNNAFYMAEINQLTLPEGEVRFGNCTFLDAEIDCLILPKKNKQLPSLTRIFPRVTINKLFLRVQWGFLT